jgi:hypothetical protein
MVSFDICEGNPGALTFLMQAYDKHLFVAEKAFQKMQDAGITGPKLYMIWNDCCDRDTDKAVDMMLNEDIDTIIKYINYENGRGLPYSN